ncbi:MAG: 30S ribosomal protein S15 [Cyanobacteria bacterium HKST-UBA06]|nr:30S ribosomal protein S15 [Cyanobacteria bacterium HKST-UBA05]MCA9799539.1 30S ribosomal protein S15 [Cyanobacteria bacterium HKST-UBA04]MCA9807383.1 30S ribosomal protein S15 [Cyanobacteria bacterium HKST-UBA06]MCA9842107.1 30S ribosomal protein S15 [Cyanobacteria bacterium HKST-UBA03]
MVLTAEDKKQLTAEFGQTESNTGSAEVQVAILSKRIAILTEHLKQNKKDFSTRRGMFKLNGRRRRLLNYLKHHRTPDEYKTLIESLGIRK